MNYIKKYFIPYKKVMYAVSISSIAIFSGILTSFIHRSAGFSDNIVQIITDYNFIDNMFEIFINNLRIAVITVLLGTTFYIGATLLTTMNLFVFSYSVTLNTLQHGVKDSISKYFHSVIELPTIILALAISYYISDILLNSLKGVFKISYKKFFCKILISVLVVVFLLLLGSIVESLVIQLKFN